MEMILKRFPLVSLKVFKNLDYQSLAGSTKVQKYFAEFLHNQKFYWIHLVKKHAKNFEGVERSWREVLHQTPVDVVKQLALAVEEFFNSYSSKQVSPLHIVAKEAPSYNCNRWKCGIMQAHNEQFR